MKQEKVITKMEVMDFIDSVQTIIPDMEGATPEEKRHAFRLLFFRAFPLSSLVPSSLVPAFVRFAGKIYDKSSSGYDGIMEEVKDRVSLLSDIDGYVPVKEFLMHRAGKTDIWDKENRTGYEKKTGCGDWLRSETYSTFEEVIAEYKRKRTKIRWDYEYKARPEGMTGKKSVKSGAEKESDNPEKKERKPLKEYNISIHIETTYKKLFDYMETYPSGIKTFFRESVRSGVSGVFLWEMQTLKNSRKKIEFLEGFNAWERGEKE